MDALGRVLVAIVLLAGLASFGGGVYLIVQRETGTRVAAMVTDCVESGGSRTHRTDCTGTWVVGGDLVGGGGHVVVGTVQGAGTGDVGRTIDATASGEEAYSRSLVLPILLIVLGLPVVVVGVLLAKGARSPRRAG
jgi:hypothetical protein